MVDFTKMIEAKRFDVDNLFRAYKLNGKEDIDKIRAGYDQFGEAFMAKFLAIVVPQDQTSHFETTLLEGRLPTPEIVGLQTPVYSTTMAATGTTAATGKGWTFWEKLLGAGINTGKAVGSILNDVNNPSSVQTAQQQAQALNLQAQENQSTKTLYIGAAAFLGVILLIFAFKK